MEWPHSGALADVSRPLQHLEDWGTPPERNRCLLRAPGPTINRNFVAGGDMDGGDYETEEDSAPETCVSPEGGHMLPRLVRFFKLAGIASFYIYIIL